MTASPPNAKTGLAIMLVACGAAVGVHLHPERLKAPGWVAYLALGVLGLGGLCVVARALRLDRVASWLVCGLLGAMTAIPSWIALGPGARQCTSVLSGGRVAVSEASCRGAFGAGACILAVMFVLALQSALRTRRRG